MSDRDLLDGEGFRVFYEETAPRLLGYVRRWLGASGQAEEVVQETYLRLLENRPAGLDPASGRAWIYTTASRLARERWRRRDLARRAARGPDGAGEPVRDRALPRHLPGAEGLDLERALRRLPARQRALLWLAYAEERSHREIAGILDLRTGSVRVLLFRARRRLAEVLRDLDLTRGDAS